MPRPVPVIVTLTALLFVGLLVFPLIPTTAPAASASKSGGSSSGSEQRKPLPSPRPDLEPDQVVKTVMEAMQQNDADDSGIQTAFRFASPGNKQVTGPIERFAKMVKGPAYGPMLNFKAIEYGRLQKDGDEAQQEITITDANGAMIKYLFGLSRQDEDPFKDCWMTDTVIRANASDAPAQTQQPIAPGPVPVKT